MIWDRLFESPTTSIPEYSFEPEMVDNILIAPTEEVCFETSFVGLILAASVGMVGDKHWGWKVVVVVVRHNGRNPRDSTAIVSYICPEVAPSMGT